ACDRRLAKQEQGNQIDIESKKEHHWCLKECPPNGLSPVRAKYSNPSRNQADGVIINAQVVGNQWQGEVSKHDQQFLPDSAIDGPACCNADQKNKDQQ